MDDGLAFRDADPSEDDELARIMYNAFLPIWYGVLIFLSPSSLPIHVSSYATHQTIPFDDPESCLPANT